MKTLDIRDTDFESPNFPAIYVVAIYLAFRWSMIIVLYVRVELRRECLVVCKFVLVKLAIIYSCPAISIQSNYISIILVQFKWSFSSSIFWFLFSSYYTSHCTLSFKNGDSIACRVEMCAERVKFFLLQNNRFLTFFWNEKQNSANSVRQFNWNSVMDVSRTDLEYQILPKTCPRPIHNTIIIKHFKAKSIATTHHSKSKISNSSIEQSNINRSAHWRQSNQNNFQLYSFNQSKVKVACVSYCRQFNTHFRFGITPSEWHQGIVRSLQIRLKTQLLWVN